LASKSSHIMLRCSASALIAGGAEWHSDRLFADSDSFVGCGA
jgi:hypothetical protein